MKHCEGCRVDISGERGSCPLCGADLTGEAGPSPYPSLPLVVKKNRLLLRAIDFVLLAAAVISALVNFAYPENGVWAHFVAGGVASFWLSLWFIIQKRGNIHKTITWEVALLSIAAVIWDAFTGFYGWSLDYVVPIACTGALLAMTIIALVRKLDIQDFLIYLFIDAIFGITSLILLLGGFLTVRVPSLICAASCLLFLAALFIFEGKGVVSELQRRLHI